MVRWIGPTTGHNELVEKSFLGRYNRTIGGLLQAVQDRFLSFVDAPSVRFSPLGRHTGAITPPTRERPGALRLRGLSVNSD